MAVMRRERRFLRALPAAALLGALCLLAAAGPAAPATVPVRPGETLSAIAARAGTTPAALARLNGIADPDLVLAGSRLRLPGPGGLAAPPTSASGTAGTVDIPSLIARSAARHGLSPALARAVAWQESGFRQEARSAAGAVGVMQLMPATARWVGPALLGRAVDPYATADNVEAGIAYLAWLLRRTGNVPAALAAYNQGPNSVRRNGTFRETRGYVASVLSLVGRV